MERGPRPAYRSRFSRTAGLCRGLAIALTWLPWVSHAIAVEESERFLRGLKDRGYADMVLGYLKRMETSSLVGDEFRWTIPYHRGLALIEQSRRATSIEIRSELLESARDELQQFADTHPQRVEGVEARSQLASVLVEQAKQLHARAKRLSDRNTSQPQRTTLLNEARGQFEQAHIIFEDSQKFYSEALQSFPKTLDPKTEQHKIQQRQEFRGRLAQARVLAVQTDYEKAQTYDADTTEYKQLVGAAADQFAALFEEYSDWLVGSYALLYEGRCYQALQDLRRAQGSYDTLIASADSVGATPEFRELITKSHRYKVECQLAQGQVDAAIAVAQSWLRSARGVEDEQPDWLALRFRLAEAYQQKAGQFDDNSPQHRKLSHDASEAYREVALHPGDFQKQARAAITDLGIARRNVADPSTFAEAYDAGKGALDAMNSAQMQLADSAQDSPDAAATLQEQLSAYRLDAAHFFRSALGLADNETDMGLINDARYFLCWLNFQQKDYYRGAVLGEFVSRRYPDHQFAAAAAKIAMASYERLYNEAIASGESLEGSEFEAGRLADMAEFITRRWSGTSDADAAFSVLLHFALRSDRLDEAKLLLENVPPERLESMQLKLGSALWRKYLESSSKMDIEAGSSLATVRAEALKLLESGISSLRTVDSITAADATAVLFLVQAQLAEGNYQQATHLLEDQNRGLLLMVRENHPATDSSDFASAVYRTALQTYVSVVPPQSDKAAEMMSLLEQSVAGDEEAANRLTGVYIGLGLQLQRQIEELTTAGRRVEAERVTVAFADFLDHIASRRQSANWAARSWIAGTYFSMAESLRSDSARREEYFARAAEAYQDMIRHAEQEPDYAPDQIAVLAATKRLGQSQSQSGQFQQALDAFSAVLKDNEARLDVQKAAAYTYQMRGEAEDAKWLLRAIGGGYKLRSTGKNRIWGWARIAAVVKRYIGTEPQHRDTYFEAWLNVARCRYLMGMKTNASDRTAQMSRAKATIAALIQQYPELGGDPWHAEFERLALQIQRAEGTAPQGLSEFTTSAAQSRP